MYNITMNGSKIGTAKTEKEAFSQMSEAYLAHRSKRYQEKTNHKKIKNVILISAEETIQTPLGSYKKQTQVSSLTTY